MAKFDPTKMPHFTAEETAALLRAWSQGTVTIQGSFEEITVQNAHLVNPHLKAWLN